MPLELFQIYAIRIEYTVVFFSYLLLLFIMIDEAKCFWGPNSWEESPT